MQSQVFISYRHESPEHKAAVRRLAMSLRDARVPVQFDQFFLEDHPGGPDDGWTKWCEDSANESRCVLIVASKGWFDAYNKTDESASGFGAAAEADLFRQHFWDDKGSNDRVRLVYLHDICQTLVPVRLRAWHAFRPFAASDEFDGLLRWIACCLEVETIRVATLNWPSPAPFVPDLADRTHHEWPAIVDVLTGRSRKRILLVEGCGGVGKSELLRQATTYARVLGIPTCQMNFKESRSSLETVVENIFVDIGDHLPNFSHGGLKPYLLRKDLRNVRKPVLLVFDTYEGAAENRAVADFVQELLADVEACTGLVIIVAGQKVPEPALPWRDFARHLRLEMITAIEAWDEWISRRYPHFRHRKELETLVRATQGSPLLMSTLCTNLMRDV